MEIKNRLESLDVLRGLDLFILVFFQPILWAMRPATSEDSWLRTIVAELFTHVEWEGFHLWDQVMPLFLFMSGASIPFALSKYKRKEVSNREQLQRIFKRVFLLWIFGAIVQGNLLNLKIDDLYLYTDTLQAIAMGYLFTTLLYMFCSIRGVLIATFLLPIVYTTGMMCYAGYEPGNNLAELIDQKILGRFLYGATVKEGTTIFASWYHISWIWSTLNFTATVLFGLLSGYILKTGSSNKKKLKQLALLAGSCFMLAAIFYLAGEPIIKRLWTSSMLFLSSGISITLLLLMYYIIDIKQITRPFNWLKIYGLNSILAYMMYNTLNMKGIFHYWLHGLQPITGDYYGACLETAKVIFIFWILWYCHKQKRYFKV